MRALIVRAVVVVLLPGLAAAQTVLLTESEALAQLSSDNPRVRRLSSGVALARVEVEAAGRWPNPRAAFNREAVAGVVEQMVTVSQVLPVTGRRGFDVRAASARLDATSQRAAGELRRLRADLRLSFTELWLAQALERELTRSRDRLAELAAVLARREAAGDAAGFDRLRVEREAIDADADRSGAAARRGRAQALLAGYVSSPTDPAPIEAVRPDGPRTPVPGIEELVAAAERTRGELAALQLEIDAAQFAERAAERQRIPEPEVTAGTKRSNAGLGDVGSVVSVHVSVPLFDRARPERAAAQARASQLRVELEALRRVVRADVTAWRAALVERRAAVDRYRDAAANADQVERIAQVSYDAGVRGILELIDAHRTASEARARLDVLEAAVREAEIELEFASGWEMP